jgi:hypothetical protein
LGGVREQCPLRAGRGADRYRDVLTTFLDRVEANPAFSGGPKATRLLDPGSPATGKQLDNDPLVGLQAQIARIAGDGCPVAGHH